MSALISLFLNFAPHSPMLPTEKKFAHLVVMLLTEKRKKGEGFICLNITAVLKPKEVHTSIIYYIKYILKCACTLTLNSNSPGN